MERLNSATLRQLPWIIERPTTSRPEGPRIVHLGLGAFARAHLAAFTQEANARAGSRWQITGVSLQRPDMRDALAPQEGLYTLVIRAPAEPQRQVLDVVTSVLVAPENPEAVVAVLADRETHIVSLTITEKGYCHHPASGKLNLEHPDIVHDRANIGRPRSAPGFLVAGLAARHRAGLPPYTILTCDNLPANGALVRGLVLEFARLLDPALAAWIEREGAFPSTMVDRIVPATTPADIEENDRVLGLHDAAPVIAEPFRQWAIEDHFASGRPAWETAGAEMVADVAPFELMKLRMLNGAHSSLAYLGYLSGQETVSEASSDPAMAAFLEALWAEIIPTVPAPPGVDLADYAKRLLVRFRNPAIRHRTWQIAMDGSQKLPQRLLGTLRWRLERGLPVPALTLGIAGWMRYVTGVDERGAAIDVRDPMAARLASITRAAGEEPAGIVAGLLGISEIFGEDLPASKALREGLIDALRRLYSGGARGVLTRFSGPAGNRS